MARVDIRKYNLQTRTSERLSRGLARSQISSYVELFMSFILNYSNSIKLNVFDDNSF